MISVVVALVTGLAGRGETVACAESLTGGLVCARLIGVPGASAVVRGGVVAYATELKHTLLGVDAELLAAHGAVHRQVAVELARGVRERLSATYGLATTGVAGPDPQDGHPPGTVHVAVAGPAGDQAREHRFAGDRAQVRRQAVDAVLALLADVLLAATPAIPPSA